MEQSRRYAFEGVTLEIPLRYDARSQMYLEEYPDFAENPVYTSEGCPVLFLGEDACVHAEAADGGDCLDCGACRFFRPVASHTWIGVCGHAKRRQRPKTDTPPASQTDACGEKQAEERHTYTAETGNAACLARDREGTVHILVNFSDLAERNAFCGMLQIWMELTCVSMDIVTTKAAVPPPAHAIVFWDLDGPDPPPPVGQGPDCALFLCSRDPQRAIDSYAFHPTGFLTKPVSMDQLWNAMLRCSGLWFASLMRLELYSDRVKVGVPFKNLIWAEGTRRGCMLHTSHQSIVTREPLYRLEQRLPQVIFARCQRSFVVNLTHVREITGNSLFLCDGTEISLGRGNKPGVLQAYQQFCRLRYGE